ILADEGLGFAELEGTCGTLTDLGDLEDCVVAQHECRTEQVFETQAPRAGELLRRAGVSLGSASCLSDHGDAGAAGDPRTVGKAVDKCQEGIKKAGEKFAAGKLRSLAKCVDALFTCVQTKPDFRDPTGFSP